jgi:hypothetical protein
VAHAGAKKTLTSQRRKANLDNVPSLLVDEPATAVDDAVRRLHDTLHDVGAGAPLASVAAARELARAADRALRDAVDGARAAGASWADIGEVLGSSRQAAFQRFGRPLDPRTGVPMARAMLPDALDRAVELFGDLAAGRWRAVRGHFDDVVSARLDADRLAAVWAQVIGTVGEYLCAGEPTAHQAGDYTVVDVPLFFEAGTKIGRVSYGREGTVAGLFVLNDPTPRRNRRLGPL